MSRRPLKFSTIVNEGSTVVFTGILKDENGTAIGLGIIDSMTMTFFDVESGTVINGRTEQDVLNANNCTVDASGLFTFNLQPADTVILNQVSRFETHRAEVGVLYNGSAGRLVFDADINIRNIKREA